ncbi:hypothetical protein QBC46DRAFT_57773 [Diplogelasinospora grovesii]|uniref:Uncharacterized protein n=1 Tax=Diplogelasinospora grovesii TaxID=303347 RepID=A0AAN6S752_9PEZI|nr:hypothetical protein QBC46DRAFT_57773 [Diplogelasinospora grovesii]
MDNDNGLSCTVDSCILGLHGLQYNDCLAILFPFYIAAEIPSNMMMKRVRPSIWLTFIMVCWSVARIG